MNRFTPTYKSIPRRQIFEANISKIFNPRRYTLRLKYKISTSFHRTLDDNGQFPSSLVQWSKINGDSTFTAFSISWKLCFKPTPRAICRDRSTRGRKSTFGNGWGWRKNRGRGKESRGWGEGVNKEGGKSANKGICTWEKCQLVDLDGNVFQESSEA